MNPMMIQVLIWLLAAAVLFLFIARRRKRKVNL
jgi:MYXO-CTERM domain-containing protein